MKILLITLNSKHVHSNLALRYLSKKIKENWDWNIIEFTINQKEDIILRELYENNSDIYAFSVYIWNFEQTLRIINNLKRLKPKSKILLGGPEVSYEYNNVIKLEYVDYIIKGEGDTSFSLFLDNYYNNELIKTPGLVTKEFDNDFFEPEFDEILFPYDEKDILEDKMIYYESSRGCPYKCSYCLSSSGKKTRFKELDQVLKDIDFFIRKKPRIVKFIDRTFNIDKERSISIINHIIKNDNGVTTFHMELSPNNIDDEFIDCLKGIRCGLIQFEIGVQSIYSQVVKEISRKQEFFLYKDMLLKLMENKNIHIHLDLIAGLPFETFQMYLNSFREVINLNPDHFQLGILKLIKGTKLRKESNKYDYLFEKTQPYPILSNKFLSYEQLQKIKDLEETMEVFYNSQNMTNVIKLLKNNYDLSNILIQFSEYLSNIKFFKIPKSVEEKFYAIKNFLKASNMYNYEIAIMLHIDYSFLKPNKKINFNFGINEVDYKKVLNKFPFNECIDNFKDMKRTDVLKRIMILIIEHKDDLLVIDYNSKEYKIFESKEWRRYLD
jgi:radical SAM superfamily enzyme YgiQ (UPF0313 family)